MFCLFCQTRVYSRCPRRSSFESKIKKKTPPSLFFGRRSKIRATLCVDKNTTTLLIASTKKKYKNLYIIIARITHDLLRRRAEHNDGIVRTLREVSLHRQNLEAIDACVQRDCRELRILLLHDNQIRKLGASSLSRRVSL